MMSRHRLMFLASVLAVSGCARPSQSVPATQWDDTRASEVRAQVETTMNAFARFDLASFEAGLTPNVVAFEMDLETKPVRFGSRAEVSKWAEATFAELKKMGANATLDIHSNNCRATATVAFCTVEFDLKATMGDGTTMTQPSRNAVVLQNFGDGWKWTHWHSSPSGPAAQSAASTPK